MRLWSLATCLVISAAAAQQPEPNALPNPSFEFTEPGAHGTSLPRTWSLQLDGDAGWRCPEDPQQARTGRRYGQLAADRGRGSLRFGPMPVPERARWTVRLWARGQGELALGGFLTFAEKWERMPDETVIPLTADWAAYEWTTEPDPACGWWVLDIATRGPTEAWIDDVSATYPGLPALNLPPDRPLGTDDHTLLYLPFDEQAAPDGSFVKGEVGLSEAGAGRFGKSLVLGRGSYVAGPRSGYLALAEGTVEAWVRPQWPGNDGAGHAFVSVPGWNGMWLGKDQYGHVSFSFAVNWGTVARAWADGYANSWQPGVWRHVAACWDQSLMQVFVDGKLVACAQSFSLPPMLGPELKLGDAMMELDDLRISDVVRYRLPVPPPATPGLRGGTLPRSG